MNPEQFLYVRYPEQQWTRFDTSNINTSTIYQKELLEKFILMDTETSCIDDIIISREPITKNNKLNNSYNSDISYIYYYTTTDNDINIEFMYNDPSYVAYINRLVD